MLWTLIKHMAAWVVTIDTIAILAQALLTPHPCSFKPPLAVMSDDWDAMDTTTTLSSSVSTADTETPSRRGKKRSREEMSKDCKYYECEDPPKKGSRWCHRHTRPVDNIKYQAKQQGEEKAEEVSRILAGDDTANEAIKEFLEENDECPSRKKLIIFRDGAVDLERKPLKLRGRAGCLLRKNNLF